MNTKDTGLVKILNYHEEQIVLHVESIFKTAEEFKEYIRPIHILEHIAILAYHKLGHLYEDRSHRGDSKNNLHYSNLCYQKVKEFCCKVIKEEETESFFNVRKK